MVKQTIIAIICTSGSHFEVVKIKQSSVESVQLMRNIQGLNEETLFGSIVNMRTLSD